MSRLAKSSAVVLIEGAVNMKRHGGPDYVVDRLAVLASIALENRTEAHRLIKSLYACLPEETDALGNCDAPGRTDRAPVTEDKDL